MMAKKKLFPLLLALMVLLTGCGGGPSAAEGAESPPNSEASVPIEDTQSPKEPQETEPVPNAEVLSWVENTVQIISPDTILAKSSDNRYAILNIDGTVRTWLPDYQTISSVNQYCFTAMSDGINSLLDLNGNVMIEDVKEVWNKCQTSDDPWGIIQYTAVERQDFGEKTTTYLMRTDTFENVLEVDGDPLNIRIYYDGTEYRMEKTDPASGEITWSTLDGTPAEPYQVPAAAPCYIDESVLDCAPYIYQIDSEAPHDLFPDLAVDGKIEVKVPAILKYSEDKYKANSNVQFGLMDLSGNKITDIKYQRYQYNDHGALFTTPDGKTDLYDINGIFCLASDSVINFEGEEFSCFSSLKTNNQYGIYDFEKREFIFITKDSVSTTRITDKYYSSGPRYENITALYLYNTAGLHTLVCSNGSLIEDVALTQYHYSVHGRLLVQSTTELTRLMIVDVETGEIVSEFQAHLTK